MRTKLSLAAILLATGSHASAADLPMVPDFPAPPAALLWSGFYIGANLGGGFAVGRSDFSVGGTSFATVSNPLQGFVGGGQIGYNVQSGPVVYGLEADFQYAALRGSISAPCTAGFCGKVLSADYHQQVPWFGTVRGRAGYAAAGWLFYATGGYAYARLETDARASAAGATASVSTSDFRSGWMLGTGVEVLLSPGWSAKLEYLYLDFGRHTTNFAFGGLPTVADNSRLDMNVVRAGVNYRF
jgi:outer membrane immunogenic protein